MLTKTEKNFKQPSREIAVVLILLILHLVFAFFLQSHAKIGGDGIFTYTLANNPYSFAYIDPAYKKLPENNGWISAHVLRESYIVEEYDRFNYSSVYFHQRIDNHPLLYYSLVHTICSLFPGTYSRLFTMIINLIFLCAIDVLIIKLFSKIYDKAIYAAVPFTCLFFLLVMQQLYILPRMYLILAFFCLWYLYLHWNFLTNARWQKSDLMQMILCIFLGSQTHYYFYVYAGSLTILTLAYLAGKRQRYKLFNYVYSGMIGIAASWILFPWIVWHIFFNQMQKHTSVAPWSMAKLQEYISFLNERLFNGRGFLAIAVLLVLYIIMIFRQKSSGEHAVSCEGLRLFERMTLASSLMFSLIIFTLDESVWYYSTPLYLIFILWFSMKLIHLFREIITHRNADIITISVSVACLLLIFSVSATTDFIREHVEQDKQNTAFSQVASTHKQYDCIFIEERQDNLLQGYFLEFGDYDEFKKIPIDTFHQYGIQDTDLDGRTSDSGLIIYAPVTCTFDESVYQLLESNGDYNVYEMIKEAK